MNDHRRYQPHYRGKPNKDRRFDDGENNDFKHHYKKSNSYHHHFHSSSRHDDRLNHHHYRDSSHRYSNRNTYRYQYQQSKSKNSSSFSTPPPSLLSLPIVNPMSTTHLANPIQPPLPPPLPPPPPPPSQPPPVVSHERESWVRSVKKTKFNESIEQKTQYLETMLRLPQQQKTTVIASRFDRMRFANDQSSPLLTTRSISNSVDTPSTLPQDSIHLNNYSFDLVSDIDGHDNVETNQRILFDQQFTPMLTNDEQFSNQKTIVESATNSNVESNDDQQEAPSGFLIADCDEEIEQPLALSPLPAPSLATTLTTMPTTTNEEPMDQISEDDINKRRVLLLNELDAAEAERKQILKHQKRLQQSFQQRKSSVQTSKNQVEQQKTVASEPDIDSNEQQTLLADWIIEDEIESNDPVTQLKNEVRNSSLTMNDEEKTAKVNLILMKIKKQQSELKKLKQYVMSILGEQSTTSTSKSTRTPSVLTDDLLFALLNQPRSTGCWLCSGKMYSEAGTQYDSSMHE